MCSSIQLVIFDCDGVLIDSEIIAARVHARAFTREGWPVTEAGMIARFTGIADPDMYAIVERELGRSLTAGHDARVAGEIDQAYRTELRAIDGIHDALARVSMPVCVASSSAPEKLRLGLGLVGLYEHFSPDIFSATMVANGKPAPDLFLFAASCMSADPAHCVVVEDSVAGVQAAIAARMAVIGFTGGGHCGPDHAAVLQREGADLVIDDIRDLPSALAGLAVPRIG
jgi:HAD superfamily hydrolase (TIGR01509 family)